MPSRLSPDSLSAKQTLSAPIPSTDLWTARAVTLCMFLGAAVATLRPVLSGSPWMLFVEDDFFYYLKVAHNLAQGNGSTFNGLVATNGYHPLWLLLLTAVCALSTAPKVVFGFVALATFVSSMAVYFLTRRLLQLSGLALLPACALAVYATVYAMHVLFGGMEIVLTVPLVLLVVWLAIRPGLWEADTSGPITKRFMILGFAISAMILSRLDTILLVALIGIGVLSEKELRSKIGRRALLGLALGLVPVALYFVSNILIFHTLLPISGQAKQLKVHLTPSLRPWASAFHHSPLQLSNLVPILLAMILIAIPRVRLSRSERVVYLPVLAFPFLYIALLSVLSDWQLWGWYLYPFRTAFCVSLAVLCTLPSIQSLLANRAVAIILLLLVLIRLPSATWPTAGRDTIYDAALNIRDFALTHPGRYAMGDRSGLVGWLIPDSIVQTEGLVMDKAFLTSIRTQQPLRSVLAPFGVRYYIASSETPLAGCFHAVEPAQAGADSPHMRADFCKPPLAVFHHGSWYNFVYDLGDGS